MRDEDIRYKNLIPSVSQSTCSLIKLMLDVLGLVKETFDFSFKKSFRFVFQIPEKYPSVAILKDSSSVCHSLRVNEFQTHSSVRCVFSTSS